MLTAFAVLAHVVDLQEVTHVALAADLRWVLLAGTIVVVSTIISSKRLAVLAHLVGHQCSLLESWRAVIGACSLNAILPGKGGDFSKAFFLGFARDRLIDGLGLLVLERLLDVWTLGAMSLAGSLLIGRFRVSAIAAAVLVSASAGVAMLMLSDRLPRGLARFRSAGKACRQMRRQPGRLGLVAALTVALWANNIVVLTCTLQAVGVVNRPVVTVSAAPIAFIAGAIPVSFGGLGTRDGVLLLLLAGMADRAQILAGSFLYTVIAYWFLGLIGLAALGHGMLRSPMRRMERPECR